MAVLAGTDVRAVDRLVNAVRGAVEAVLPWYDPAEAHHRARETERVRQRSIAARIRVEDVVEQYRRGDGTFRR
jgi:hypothetical protein